MEEQVLYKGFANIFKKMEGVGGTLYLYNDRLEHKPHAVNIQTENTIIPFEKIKEVATRNTGGFIPNGLSVRTQDGKEYRFVVYKRKRWVAEINKARNN